MSAQPLQPLPQFNMGDRVAWKEGTAEHKGRYIAPDARHPDYARVEPDDERLLSNDEKSVVVHPIQLRLVARTLATVVVMPKPAQQAQPEQPKEQVQPAQTPGQTKQPEQVEPQPQRTDLCARCKQSLKICTCAPEKAPEASSRAPQTNIFTQPQFVDPLPFVPAELKAKRNWVRWKLEAVDGRLTKVPYQLNGKKASSTDPSTWNTYEAIVNGAVLSGSQGIGIMTDGTFVGFDLDGCRNPVTGEIKPWAKRIIDLLDAYTEITPSGTGVRVLALGPLPDGARRFPLALSAGFGDKVGIETYDQARYFTVTGSRLGETSTLQSPNVLQAYHLCAEIGREFPSDKRKAASQFGGNDSNSSVVFTQAPGTVLTTKLAVLMYGKIISNRPFEVQDEHGSNVVATSQSEADESLATLLAMKHGDDPDAIDSDFRESSLYRPKWERDTYRKPTIEKAIKKAIAIESAKSHSEKTPIKIPAAEAEVVTSIETTTAPTATAAPTQATSQAQVQADVAAEASKDAEGSFPNGNPIQIAEFDEAMVTGVFRDLVDAVCEGTTIPRQFGLLATKAIACCILTNFKIKLEDCESARTYFCSFGATGSGKGLVFRRLQQIVRKAQKVHGDFVKIITAVDSEAGLRDAFFELPEGERNVPILFFVDEVKTLGQKADGKKNPEIVSGIIEMANSTTVSRAKSKKNKKDSSTKVREDSWLLVYMCAQDGDAYALAFPRTKTQGMTDRFIPEYTTKVRPGRLPEPNEIKGVQAIGSMLETAKKIAGCGTGMITDPKLQGQLDQIWNSLPEEFQTSPRLLQQFRLEMYLAAFSRASAVVEKQDLDVAVKALNRQVPIRQVVFAEEIPNQVAIYVKRLKEIHGGILQRLRKTPADAEDKQKIGKIRDEALSVPQLMTLTQAYKENDLQSFDQAWRVSRKLWTDVQVPGKNGHAYEKFLPTPAEDDVWLPDALLTKDHVFGK